MASDEFKALSQDELRKRLYQTFKNRGVLDALKTQLRNQLIHELMNPILSGEIQPQAVSSECSSLLIGASNSLVADHLRRCGYEYSLSVFYPESGLEKDKVLTMQDLLQLIRINPKTDLYKALISASEKENTKGFLVQILTELIEHSLHKQICNTETQTSPTPGKESLAEKLQLIDEQFADMYPQCHKSESFEVKLAEYRKEIEQQLQEEMSQKLQHFKEVEIAKVKMDERAQSQKEISELRREFEKVHRAKSEALTSRERNAIERLQKQQEIDAREIYLQRQSLLKDIETVRSREAELKQRIEAFELLITDENPSDYPEEGAGEPLKQRNMLHPPLAQNLQESKNKTVEDALRRREVTVRTIEETYDQKLKNELLKYQLELKEEYIARTKKITEDEKKIKDKTMLLHEETISLNSKKQEFEHAVSHSKELELEIDSVKAQVLLLSKQNQLLTEKLEEVSDYSTLKEEKMELQVQNKLLKQQLEEACNEILQLRDKLSRPSAEYLVLEAELKRAKHARKLECEESDTHKQLLEKQLQNEVEHCVQLKTQLSECENTIRKLNAQMEDLKLQLKQTQTALENEVYRNPKPSLVDRSVIDLFDDKTVPPDIYIDGAFLKTQPVADIIGMGNSTSSRYHRQHILKSSTSQDSDLEFVANTKARIKELEREAEYLEEAYRNYQYRAIQTTAGPAKTTSSSPMPSNFAVASRQRLWFAQDDLYSQELPFHCQNSKSYRWTPGNGDPLKDHLTPPRKRSTSRRLSSTPVSKAKRNISNKLFSEDTVVSSFTASHQNADQPLSPIQRTGNLSSLEHASNISVSSSPASCKQKLSLHHEQGETQCVSDSAKPEKHLGNNDSDLGNDDSASKYQEDIPEQLESVASHPSHIVSGSYVPATVPAAGPSQQDISGAEIIALEKQKQHEEKEEEEEEKEEEQKWEDREEKGQRERQDTLEKEQGELEKANEELCMQESVETEKRHKDVADLETSISKSEHGGEVIPNPLEKYMKIIQQNQEQELANEDFKKEGEVSSEKLSGSEKENSFSAAATLHEEPDEDFW